MAPKKGEERFDKEVKEQAQHRTYIHYAFKKPVKSDSKLVSELGKGKFRILCHLEKN